MIADLYSTGYHGCYNCNDMKKEEDQYYKFSSIADAHRYFGLPGPLHPLVSMINNEQAEMQMLQSRQLHVLSFYKISYRRKANGCMKYGQGYYDFEEGGLFCASPNQLVGTAGETHEATEEAPLYTLLIHPDFLWNYPLAKKIRQYGFFSYTANEALHLSPQEETTVIAIFKMIGDELSGRIDDFSQDVVISQLELLLNYINRFYKRQFITRKVVNSNVLQKLEELVNDYFDKDVSLKQGLPTVQYLAAQFNLSPSYLSDMVRALIGQNVQQYIHSKLIEKAKEKLSTTSLSVSEVAYELGFEHPQSFSKLFKSKTNVSPLEFRRSFN